MHSKLVATACYGLKFQATRTLERFVFVGDTTPACHTWLPFGVDGAKGSVGPVHQNRQVNGLPLRVDGQKTGDASHIPLCYLAVFKRRIETALGPQAPSHQQKSRGRHIKTVYYQCI